jgi:opacity protein-like surface antigen
MGVRVHYWQADRRGRSNAAGLFRAGALFVLLVVAFSALSGNGERSKEHPNDHTLAAGSAWQFGGYLGASDTRGHELQIEGADGDRLTVEGLNWIGKSFRPPLYWGVRGLYWPARFSPFGVLVDFTHIKAIAPLDQTVEFERRQRGKAQRSTGSLRSEFKRLQFSHGHNLVTLNGIARLPLFGGWLKPYAGFGAGVAVPHVEVWRKQQTKDERTDQYLPTGPALQALVGVEVVVSEHLSLFFEYKLNYARIDVELVTGERLTTNLFTHQGIAGALGSAGYH